MQTLAVVGKPPSEVGTHGSSWRRKATLFMLSLKLFASEVSMDFDPRSIDDSRDRDVYGRELNQGRRGGLSNPRERERLDPRDVFTMPGPAGEPPGPTLQSAEGRARLHVFTMPNEQRTSPAAFIARTVTDRRERLSYSRVTNRFLVFSAAEGNLILYRRCNFVRARIHCFDVRYPRAEKRRWDGAVTRMSFSLRPR